MDYTSDEDSLSESGDSSVSTESSREEIEFEEQEEVDHNSNEVKSDLEEGPYSEEPLADDEWMEEYTRERKLIEDRQKELQNRLERVVDNNIWCKCGNCCVDLLQNAMECQCCHEIEGCVQSLSCNLVLRELHSPPGCVTLHPGFRPVCLNRWSLRSAAAKYKTQDGTRYRQTGTEEEFLRVASYREFTQLVHGYLGFRRIPLPACAYHVIRKELSAEGASFTGYEEDD